MERLLHQVINSDTLALTRTRQEKQLIHNFNIHKLASRSQCSFKERDHYFCERSNELTTSSLSLKFVEFIIFFNLEKLQMMNRECLTIFI